MGLANGHQRGFWLSLLQYTGMVLGVVAGAAGAPRLDDLLGLQGSVARPLVAAIVLLAAGSIGSSLGYYLGEPVYRRLVRTAEQWELDRVLGAAFSGLAVMAVAWFLGISFSQGPSPGLAALIQRSTILRQLDGFFPRPPGFLAGVERTLAGVPFPFAGLEPVPPSPAPLPTSIKTAGVIAAEGATVKVEGRGCGGLVTGSAFPVAPDYLVTNAHVVSGTDHTVIYTPDGRQLPAQVVFFDSNRDVAVLRVPGHGLKVLAEGSAGHGTQGAVIGYPGGGPETGEPAVVDGEVNAQGRDIYNQNLVTRHIWIIQSSVHPGNSGGPLVDLGGNRLGVVFAASSQDPNQAYALTNGEVDGDIAQGVRNRSAIDTSGYSCAV